MNWWQKRQQVDPFVKKRREEGVLSRSYFKIEEIYKKYKIKSKEVLDIGAAPGGWTQYLSPKCVQITCIDLQDLKINKTNIKFIKIDIRDFQSQEIFDTVLSDIAPNISGNLLVDNAFMQEMFEKYFFLVKNNLEKKGNLIFKSFQWECNKFAIEMLAPCFHNIKIFKPKSSRSTSAELYLICLNKI